jgi:large subunit ribosomal protein L23
MQHVVIKPLVTEKSMKDVSLGKYTFAVAKSASKGEIKQVVGNMFSVHVVNVATSVLKGRKTRVGKRRDEVDAQMWKRATVTLRKGERISLFEPGSATEEENKKTEKKAKKK